MYTKGEGPYETGFEKKMIHSKKRKKSHEEKLD